MLGKWAVLDIETSGVDATQDKVIDVGFVLYENDKYIEEHSLLINFDQSLDPVIIALTGISVPMLKSSGINWEDAKSILQKLDGAVVIAHNASFEESFLKHHFDEWGIKLRTTDRGNYFHDSLEVLPFLLPFIPRLGLESINQILGVKSREQHRGLEDSKDLYDALQAAHNLGSTSNREKIAATSSLTSWWKLWLTYKFPLENPATKSNPDSQIKILDKWEATSLVAFAQNFPHECNQLLFLKMAQMLGRGISGIISQTAQTSTDFEVVTEIAQKYTKHFPKKIIAICSAYFSPDESFWFKSRPDMISSDFMACKYFAKHANAFIPLLDAEEDIWSRELLAYYQQQAPAYALASRVPDFWCRKDKIVNVLWKSSKFLAKTELVKKINNKEHGMCLVLQPSELELFQNHEDVALIFWSAKQLEWNTDFNVKKYRSSDVDYALDLCSILKKLDEVNMPTIQAAEKLLNECDKIIKDYMTLTQESDSKKIYWDVDFTNLGKNLFMDWIQETNNFLKRRMLLKNYLTELHDALWSQLDELLKNILAACGNDKFGLSWRANQEKKMWEIWAVNEYLPTIKGSKAFFDYDFDETSHEYWNSVFNLTKVEKNKRFEKMQILSPKENNAVVAISVLEELQVNKLVNEIKTYRETGRVLICSHDQTIGTNIYSALTQEQKLKVMTWSEMLRCPNQEDADVVFIWDKDFHLEPLMKSLKMSFSHLIVDRIPDLSWFAWAQSLWRERASIFDMSSFEAYWYRRAAILREKFIPLAKAVGAKELVVFDTRKNKWKGESWKFIKNFILGNN